VNALTRFFVNRFMRNSTVAHKLGELAHALKFVDEQQAELTTAVKAAIADGTKVTLPTAYMYVGGRGIKISPHFLDHNVGRIVLHVETTLGCPDYLLTEMLRQALLKDLAHYHGIVDTDTKDTDGRRGYTIFVNGVSDKLLTEYNAAVTKI
jgi:hypothetical protein